MADFYGKMKAARQLRYKVLQASMVRESEKERASSIAAFVRTGEEAHKLAGHDDFSYFGLDVRGRCGVVKYKGIEVALLFKREVVEVEPGPADPVPERTIKDPADAWIQVSLLNEDAKAENKGIVDRLRQAIKSAENFKLLWSSESDARKRAESDFDKYQEERVGLQKLPGRVDSLEKELEKKTLEIEGLTVRLKEEREGRRQDRVTVVRELFPVVNTVWLAGVHRVGDALYGILNRQLVEVLGKIGILLIEPKVGERFNPELHHAVHTTQFESGAKEIDMVVQVHKVGWRFGGLVVEAADVVVGVEKEQQEDVGLGVETRSEWTVEGVSNGPSDK